VSLTFAQVRAGIETALSTIDGLRVYDYVPDNLSPPAAVIAPAPGEKFVTFNVDQNGGREFRLVVVLFVAKGTDRSGQGNLDAYLDDTGSQSIHAALTADHTLGGLVDYAILEDWGGYDIVEYAGVPTYTVRGSVMVAAG
jgi:hypothetical protein